MPSPQQSVEKLTASLQKKLEEVGPMTPNWSIYRVPKRLRQVNPDAYTPYLVSIGPFHQADPGLADMQELKWRYMLYFSRRVGGETSAAGSLLQSCAHAILAAEREVREWYAATIDLTPVDLAKLLLLDGCFVVELLFRYREGVQKEDPVFESEWMVSAVRRDLGLLENQIPFFVLKRLFYMVVEHNPEVRADYLPMMALNFFRPGLGSKRMWMPPMEAEGGGMECKHLLDLLLKCHLPWPPRSRLPAGSSAKGKGVSLRSAKSLAEVGVGIQGGDTHDSLFDFKFSKGLLRIPPLHIYDCTDSLFRNLMAFEHFCPGNINIGSRGEFMVSYVVLMDRLIQTREDVELLMSKGIITVELGGSEEVTNFFKDICRQVTVRDFYFDQLCEEVEQYCKTKWRGHLRDLKQNHLKSPWKFLSLMGAIILLVGTLLQVGYAIKCTKKKWLT